MEIQSPIAFVRLIRAIGLLVPAQFRSEWRREWESEILNRWRLLEQRGRLDKQNKVDLWRKTRGAVTDALYLQQTRTRFLVALNLLVATATGVGALQQSVIDGIGTRQMQPFLLGLAGLLVSALFVTSGLALLRRWPSVQRLITVAGALSILLHVYGVLPPHRNMGFAILLVGAGYGLALLAVFQRE